MREGGRERGREGGREGGRERGREGEREGGREGEEGTQYEELIQSMQQAGCASNIFIHQKQQKKKKKKKRNQLKPHYCSTCVTKGKEILRIICNLEQQKQKLNDVMKVDCYVL